MDYDHLTVSSTNFLSRAKLASIPALILICFWIPTNTAALQPSQTPEPKKLVKQAAKLARAGSFSEAEKLLRTAVEADENRSETKVELAYVLTKQRRLGEAFDMVYAVAEKEPKNSRAFAVLGTTLLAGGRFTEARVSFFNAIRLNRKEHLAWAGYGLLDFYENKIGDSVENLREAVYYAPDEPDYLFALAQVTARAERYREAAQAYRDFLNVSNIADSDRRARIKGVIEFLNYLGQISSLYKSEGEDNTSVPFQLIGNRPVISLRINGEKEPLRFVLDTGSGISVVSSKTARRLKIKPVTKGGFARGIGGDGKFEVIYGLLREIKIGDVRLRQVPVYIRDFHSSALEVDGYIGLALISKFLTTIDYGNLTFTLTRREADAKEFREKVDLSLPLRLTSSGFLSGKVLLQGHEMPLNFIVDTGASVSVISDDVARTDGISPFLGDEKLRVIGSAGVTENVSTFKLPKVTFGQHSRKDIMAVALDLDIINETSGFEQSGILGGNFLRNYRLTFDFRGSKVTFTSVKPEIDQQ